MPILFIIAFVCLSVHTMYFDAAKFSIKLFSFIYFIVSVVRQGDGYAIVAETRPLRLFQDINLNKNADN